MTKQEVYYRFMDKVTYNQQKVTYFVIMNVEDKGFYVDDYNDGTAVLRDEDGNEIAAYGSYNDPYDRKDIDHDVMAARGFTNYLFGGGYICK